MAAFIISECALKPLPGIYPRPTTPLTSTNLKLTPLHLSKTHKLLASSLNPPIWTNQRLVKVAASVVTTNEREEVNEVGEAESLFDPGAPPPFNLADIKAAIPKHCWVKDTWKSMSFVVRDLAAYFNTWILWPLYWFCQGTMFWALFVLGHDWRISHRTHHQNHGHVENDESWHPLSERIYRSLDNATTTLRFTLPFPMLAYPFYLWSRSPGKKGYHFSPDSDLFVPNERKDVVTSSACWIGMAALIIFVMWLDFVTYLHHHGHEDKLPWYRGKEWSYLRGGLTTLDRDYGWINNIHHDIGTRVIHHLFPQIPHYHLVEATEAAKPVLGKYYREPKRSGPLPLHLLGSLIRSMKQDHYGGVSNVL